MRSVKLTILEKIIALRLKRLALSAIVILLSITALAQDNSPYSRYGLGDQVPHTNIVNRGMAGISAAHVDPLSINFTNPASYSTFIARKGASGRVLFDVGLNFDNHTLKEPNSTEKFASSNAVFSYMQLGIPLKNNWGINFGLRQISRIGYKLNRIGPLYDPITSNLIDSIALTENAGDGGVFLASAGTGFAIKNLSIGFNLGWLFGKKEYSTRLFFFNDTVDYKPSKHTWTTSFGNLHVNGGAQYRIDLNKKIMLRLGAYGNLKQELKAEQGAKVETFISAENGDLQLDSVYEQKGIKGKIIYPAMYGVGFVIEQKPDQLNNKYGTWLLGVDFVQNKWNDYRFYGAVDSVRNSWELRIGGQIRPDPLKTGYFNKITYRAGFFVGQDYIHVVNKLPVFGISAGMALPLSNYNRLAQNQFSIINVAFEYIKRGNNENLLKENLFRVSVGLSLSDLWFIKRKYE